MAIYYHLSTNIYHEGVFNPRIPKNRYGDKEDATIDRISVAPSIEDCLTAIPGGGSALDELNDSQRGYYKIFEIDTDKLCIDEKFIVSSSELYEKDLVRDAGITNELWITTSFKVGEEDSYLIYISNWDEESLDIYPFSILKVAEDKYDGDYFRAYNEVYDTFVPCATGIININYITENVEMKKDITIYIDCEKENKLFKNYLLENYDVEIIDSNIYEVVFRMLKISNLKNLFYYHDEISDTLYYEKISELEKVG